MWSIGEMPCQTTVQFSHRLYKKGLDPMDQVLDLVETIGIEPTTSWMPFKRSPRWATPPFVLSASLKLFYYIMLFFKMQEEISIFPKKVFETAFYTKTFRLTFPVFESYSGPPCRFSQSSRPGPAHYVQSMNYDSFHYSKQRWNTQKSHHYAGCQKSSKA